jgi:hypothetical protein
VCFVFSAFVCAVRAVPGVEPLRQPVVERADVVLAGHQHATGAIGPRVHGRLSTLASVEVLNVNTMKQFDGFRDICPGPDDPGRV